MKKIQVEVTPESVRVRYQASKESPYGRFYAGLFFAIFGLSLIVLVIFSPGKHGAASIWEDLHPPQGHSSGIVIPLLFAFVGSSILFWYLAKAVRNMYPADHALVFDKDSMTVSLVPWMDWSNSKWVVESYPWGYVSGVRYGVIVSGRGGSTYGLRFNAAGLDYRLFPNLTTNQAGKILAAMEAMGVETERKINQKKRRR